MASISADGADADVTAAREARIAQRTDARCLENVLRRLRRTLLLLPMGLLWTWLAWDTGARWWSVAWFVAWAGLQVHIHRSAGRLQVEASLVPDAGIAQVTRLFVAAGCLHALSVPWFFLDTPVTAKLEITLFLACVGGPVVISTSGIKNGVRSKI